MSDETTEAGKPATAAEPLALRLNDQLGPEERAKLDALLDHIYEYGTTAEGVLRRAAQLREAARAAERDRWVEKVQELVIRESAVGFADAATAQDVLHELVMYGLKA